MRLIYTICIGFYALLTWGQEIACKILVDAKQVPQSNQHIFNKLEKSLQDFVDRELWTSQFLPIEKRLDCSIVFIITAYENENFKANIQVQSSRPVYGSVYQTNILNFREKSISFSYTENMPLYFDKAKYNTELTSLIAYYIYIVLGLDVNTFELNKGRFYFQQAESVVLNAQISNEESWKQTGKKNRWQLVNDLLSIDYELFNEAIYMYHRHGLDKFQSDINQGKENVKQAILKLGKIQKGRLNNSVIQLFFDAKADEIVQIFSSNGENQQKELKTILGELSPINSEKWKKIQ